MKFFYKKAEPPLISGLKLGKITPQCQKKTKATEARTAGRPAFISFFLASKQEYLTHFSLILVLKMSTQGELLEKVHQYICDVRRFHRFSYFFSLSLFDLPIMTFMRIYGLVSVWLLSLYFGGSKIVRFLVKIERRKLKGDYCIL